VIPESYLRLKICILCEKEVSEINSLWQLMGRDTDSFVFPTSRQLVISRDFKGFKLFLCY
jgi:hypothetical protein